MTEHRTGPLLVGVIGYPLGHSISPVFQQAALDALGLGVRYERWETPPDFLAPRVLELRRPGILGANVTVPHKQAVMKLLDELDEVAQRIGAVNTIVNRHGRLSGHNTDAPGFIRALVEDGGFLPNGRRALILGAGGAARAVAYALAGAGAPSIAIANRTPGHAHALADWLQAQHDAPEVSVLPWGAPLPETDLIVNTTTVGMRGGPAEGQSPLPPSALRPRLFVCDLVYNPAETPLLALASQAGARTLGGLPMLVYQGAISFEMWTGYRPPVHVMTAAARKALS